jgi:hypothetical protein
MASVDYILHFFGEQPPVRLNGLTTSAQTLLLSQKGTFLIQPSFSLLAQTYLCGNAASINIMYP